VQNLNGKVVFFNGTNDKGFDVFNLEGNTISQL
jgi:hypothetical protein